jgi:hypothetical protein
MGMFLFSEYLK